MIFDNSSISQEGEVEEALPMNRGNNPIYMNSFDNIHDELFRLRLFDIRENERRRISDIKENSRMISELRKEFNQKRNDDYEENKKKFNELQGVINDLKKSLQEANNEIMRLKQVNETLLSQQNQIGNIFYNGSS